LNISPDTKREYECITCVSPRQWLYLFGDGGVVYSEAKNRFAGLDTAGVAAYRAFDAGVQLEELRLISDGSEPDTVSSGGLEVIHALTQGIFPEEEPPEEWPRFEAPGFKDTGSTNIEIHGIPVSLSYPAGPLEEQCRDYFQHCETSTRAARCHLSAQKMERGWAIFVNGRKFFSLEQERQLGLGLMHAARSLLYAEGKYDVAFHAAMVAHGDRGVMLCAPRECGKSTLAAYLVAQGFDLLTDEPALLDLDSWSVAPLRLPFNLKEGSWPILRHLWPQLDCSPVHLRSDGAKIRMAYPSQTARQDCPSQSRRLTQIVFPHYAPSSPAEVESLSPLDMLRLLSEGGMLLAKHFAQTEFETFLQSVLRTPAYQIQYASLEEAREMLYDIGCFEK
jgi:hypothetical protein